MMNLNGQVRNGSAGFIGLLEEIIELNGAFPQYHLDVTTKLDIAEFVDN